MEQRVVPCVRADALSSSAVFAGLAPRHIERIAACASDRHVRAGEHLFLEGEPADMFFVVRSGGVALELDAPGRAAVVLETLHDGDVVGWSWLFPPYRWQFDGRATQPTDVLAFDGARLREACDADHELAHELMRRFAACMLERLQAARIRILDLSTGAGNG